MYIVKLEAGCWLCDMEGDPGRTLKIENAQQWKTKSAAQRALARAIEKNPRRRFDFASVEQHEIETLKAEVARLKLDNAVLRGFVERNK